MKQFLYFKHWLIFVLTFGIPKILGYLMNHFILYQFNQNIIDGVNLFFNILLMFSLLNWIWAMGSNLQKKLPDNAKMNLKLFAVAIILPILNLILAISVVLAFSYNNNENKFVTAFATWLPIFAAISLLFAIFYSAYFVAKSLKMVETQQFVSFNDFWGDFILLIFYFVGVWKIQPRINKIFESHLS